MFNRLIDNLALLLVMGLLYDILAFRRQPRRPLPRQFIAGLVLGAMGIALMINPLAFEPGIIIDARSVLLGVAGLFLGVVPTLTAMVLTATYRLHHGGIGAWTGVGVIATSGAIGLLWARLRRRPAYQISPPELYLFGVTVHLAMLGWLVALPPALYARRAGADLSTGDRRLSAGDHAARVASGPAPLPPAGRGSAARKRVALS